MEIVSTGDAAFKKTASRNHEEKARYGNQGEADYKPPKSPRQAKNHRRRQKKFSLLQKNNSGFAPARKSTRSSALSSDPVHAATISRTPEELPMPHEIPETRKRRRLQAPDERQAFIGQLPATGALDLPPEDYAEVRSSTRIFWANIRRINWASWT
ncbi:MAG: hypothetical protein LBU11_01250 [Zoogloeaceae bacterium]|jgi:hypothetical protein|nr:hypothetical protein [Zoogloeaceae bacterium]